MKARDLFLTLETNAVAPDDDFDRFVVGTLLNDSFVLLQRLVVAMINSNQPSRFQLIVGENGNGKTLLANKLKRFLSDENETQQPVASTGLARKFDVLYSHISALGKASSQTSLEIVTNLRRSELEEPEITYSLIAVQIARDFAAQYQPPFLWRLLKLFMRSAADIASLGIYGKLEEALRDKSAAQIRLALDGVSEQFQKTLNNNHYREKFEEFIGELVAFEPFVKTYFHQSGGVGVHRLRANFLEAVNRTSSLAQPRQVVEQIGQLSRRVSAHVVVIIIDDCNQIGFVEQLLPLINDLSKFTDPRIFLIVNMVQSVSDQIERGVGDRSAPQRLFYNEAIRLSGPSQKEVNDLYGRLLTLYNEAFSEERTSIPNLQTSRKGAAKVVVKAWSDSIKSNTIDSNYRAAIRFLIQQLKTRAPHDIA